VATTPASDIAQSTGTNAIVQAEATGNTGLAMGATIGIATGAGVGGIALFATCILLLRRHWKKRREANDEALQNLDALYEKDKPVFEEKDTGRWNKGLEVYHDATKPSEFRGYRS
jgi:hypothetical protein